MGAGSPRWTRWAGECSQEQELLGSLRAEPVTELVARRAGEFMRQYRRSHSGTGLADYLRGMLR